MAVTFKAKPTGTLKVQSAISDNMYSIAGVNSSLSNATDTVIEINKFLEIYGVEVAADDKTSLTIVKEGEDDE